ncbi:MAG: flagellar export chaperone FlgN [Opitutales bacterium]|nr:flagellar export chaperone FlgN [Opitutales bacterium]
MNTSNAYWSDLIQALRNELEAYGELHRLIDLQKEILLQRDPQNLFDSVEALEKHIQVMRPVSDHRKSLQDQQTSNPEVSLKVLIQSAPYDLQPLLDALHDEISRLLESSRNHMRRNQLMMNRARQINEQMQQALFPTQAAPSVYGTRGNLRKRGPVSGSQYTALS